MTKGDRGERWVTDTAEDEYGAYAQRTGASGGGTDRERGDVVLSVPEDQVDMKAARLFFIEVKTRDDPYVRFKRQEVKELEEAAERAGAYAVYLVKPDLRSYDQVHAFFKEDLKENEKSFSVVDDVLPGRSLEELIGGE